MNTVLKFIPIEIIFAFLTNFLQETIKNPASPKAQSLKPVLVNFRNLVDVLLAKLNAATPSV